MRVLSPSSLVSLVLTVAVSAQEATWTEQLLRMTPQAACAVAAVPIPAKALLRSVMESMSEDQRAELDRAVLQTRKFKGVDDLLGGLTADLESRIGIVVRRNVRSKMSKKIFRVAKESATAQWALVFWCKRDEAGKARTDRFEQFSKLVNENRRAFGVTKAFKLSLGPEFGRNAFEFAQPGIPGTGSVAIAVLDGRFVVSNSGPMLKSMVDAEMKMKSFLQRVEFKRTTAEVIEPWHGVVWASGHNMSRLVEDLSTKRPNDAVPPAVAFLASIESACVRFKLLPNRLVPWIRLIMGG